MVSRAGGFALGSLSVFPDFSNPGFHPLTQSTPQSFVSRSCVIPLDSLSGLRQLVEEVVHGAEDLGFVGIEDIVTGVRQTDHLS